jgi:hypothetical protein
MAGARLDRIGKESAPRIMVLRSQAWDVMRYVEHFNRSVSVAVWADGYAANLTSLAEQILDQLRPASGARAADRLVIEMSIIAADARMPRALALLASERALAVANSLMERGLPVLALDQGAEQARVERNGQRVLSDDGLHPTVHGERLAWRALRSLLLESGDLVTQTGDARCVDDGVVVLDGAVLEASRRCMWHWPSVSSEHALSRCHAADELSKMRDGTLTKADLVRVT